MADVRGMYALGSALNTAADTFGNLSTYAPDGLKQTAVAAGTAKAANDLNSQNQIANDAQAQQAWQDQSSGRDDFGTENYANDKVQFLQSVGASPALITKAQLDAQDAAHAGETSDTAQAFVQKMTEDRIAQTLGMRNMSQDAETALVKEGKTPAEAHQQVLSQAITKGKQEMNDEGIVVNIDHSTGNIMAMDKAGNTVPIDPDIAAAGYKMLGRAVPWNAAKDIQTEGMATDKMYGSPGYAAPAAAATGAPSVTPAQAMTLSTHAETTYKSLMLEQVKEANKAAATVTAAGGTEDQADAAHDKVMKRMQPLVDDAKAEVLKYHQIMSGTPAVQAAAAAPPTPAPAAPAITPAAAAAAAAGAAKPSTGASPAVQTMANASAAANPPPAQNPQQVAQAAAQLVQNLHLDRQNLASPEVQQWLSTLDPNTHAAIEELMNHIATVRSAGTLPPMSNFTNPRAAYQ